MVERSNLNRNLHLAKLAKEDEFYTQISDIEKELRHYREHFKGKHIFLNCDDPKHSNFWRYFELNFGFLEIEHLTATHYDEKDSTYRLDIYYDKSGQQTFVQTDLKGNGDFRSDEAIEILKECDIVVTNPPFSLFGEYVNMLVDYNKDFVILGSQNALTTNQVFPLIVDNKIWTGVYYGNMEFRVPNREEYKREGARFWIDEEGNYWRSLGNICWYTNLYHFKRNENLILFKTYNEEEYPRYDNYDAIDVSKVSEIPVDYDGVMGVPITFSYKHNPNQFEIIGQTHSADKTPEVEALRLSDKHRHRGLIDGKQKYARILIKKRDEVGSNENRT